MSLDDRRRDHGEGPQGRPRGDQVAERAAKFTGRSDRRGYPHTMSHNQPPPPGPYGGGQRDPTHTGRSAQPVRRGAAAALGAQSVRAAAAGLRLPQQPSQQAGYGYPQQPNSYGQPQPPFPGPGAPGGGRNKTKIIAITAAGLVVVGAIATGAVVLSQGDDKPQAMKLVAPKTLDDGTYKLDKGTKDLENEGTSVQDRMPEGATSVLAQYTRAEDSNSGLAFSGVYGEFSDPDKVRDEMFKGFSGGDASPTVEEKRKKFQPEGADGPSIECEVVKMYDRIYAPACAWAEKTDAAMVLDVNAEHTSVDDADMEAFAKVTAASTRTPANPPERNNPAPPGLGLTPVSRVTHRRSESRPKLALARVGGVSGSYNYKGLFSSATHRDIFEHLELLHKVRTVAKDLRCWTCHV